MLITCPPPVSNNQEVNIMTLMELQEILGERIRIASDDTLSIDERRKETELSQTISSLAKQMINNADVVLRTDKLVAEGKLQNSNIERLVGKNV
jgi:hypothetical protein